MKNLNKILSILLVLSLAACMLIGFTACTEPEEDPCTAHVDDDKNGKCDKCGETVEPVGDGKVDYTVTVKDDNGDAVEGATVVIYLQGVAEKGEADTDADGKVTFRLKEGSYSAAVVSAPIEYGFDEDEKVNLANNAATITLEKLPTYTIYVKNASGQAIEGAEVQLCTEDDCRLPKLTDADGKVVYVDVEGTFKAKVLAADGYVLDGQYHYLVNGEVTIVLAAQ